jgi:hypothetical protein
MLDSDAFINVDEGVAASVSTTNIQHLTPDIYFSLSLMYAATVCAAGGSRLARTTTV